MAVAVAPAVAYVGAAGLAVGSAKLATILNVHVRLIVAMINETTVTDGLSKTVGAKYS